MANAKDSHRRSLYGNQNVSRSHGDLPHVDVGVDVNNELANALKARQEIISTDSEASHQGRARNLSQAPLPANEAHNNPSHSGGNTLVVPDYTSPRTRAPASPRSVTNQKGAKHHSASSATKKKRFSSQRSQTTQEGNHSDNLSSPTSGILSISDVPTVQHTPTPAQATAPNVSLITTNGGSIKTSTLTPTSPVVRTPNSRRGTIVGLPKQSAKIRRFRCKIQQVSAVSLKPLTQFKKDHTPSAFFRFSLLKDKSNIGSHHSHHCTTEVVKNSTNPVFTKFESEWIWEWSEFQEGDVEGKIQIEYNVVRPGLRKKIKKIGECFLDLRTVVNGPTKYELEIFSAKNNSQNSQTNNDNDTDDDEQNVKRSSVNNQEDVSSGSSSGGSRRRSNSDGAENNAGNNGASHSKDHVTSGSTDMVSVGWIHFDWIMEEYTTPHLHLTLEPIPTIDKTLCPQIYAQVTIVPEGKRKVKGNPTVKTRTLKQLGMDIFYVPVLQFDEASFKGLLKVELLVIIKPKHKKYEKLYISDSSCVVRVADIIIRQNGELIKFERELNKANDVAAKLKVLARWENLPAYVQLTNEIYNSKLGVRKEIQNPIPTSNSLTAVPNVPKNSNPTQNDGPIIDDSDDEVKPTPKQSVSSGASASSSASSVSTSNNSTSVVERSQLTSSVNVVKSSSVDEDSDEVPSLETPKQIEDWNRTQLSLISRHPLPKDWTHQFDPRGAICYSNKNSKKITWDHPLLGGTETETGDSTKKRRSFFFDNFDEPKTEPGATSNSAPKDNESGDDEDSNDDTTGIVVETRNIRIQSAAPKTPGNPPAKSPSTSSPVVPLPLNSQKSLSPTISTSLTSLPATTSSSGPSHGHVRAKKPSFSKTHSTPNPAVSPRVSANMAPAPSHSPSPSPTVPFVDVNFEIDEMLKIVEKPNFVGSGHVLLSPPKSSTDAASVASPRSTHTSSSPSPSQSPALSPSLSLSPSPSPCAIASEEDMSVIGGSYEPVLRVIGKRTKADTTQYRVLFLGQAWNDAVWVSSKNLRNCEDMIAKFEEKMHDTKHDKHHFELNENSEKIKENHSHNEVIGISPKSSREKRKPSKSSSTKNPIVASPSPRLSSPRTPTKTLLSADEISPRKRQSDRIISLGGKRNDWEPNSSSPIRKSQEKREKVKNVNLAKSQENSSSTKSPFHENEINKSKKDFVDVDEDHNDVEEPKPMSKSARPGKSVEAVTRVPGLNTLKNMVASLQSLELHVADENGGEDEEGEEEQKEQPDPPSFVLDSPSSTSLSQLKSLAAELSYSPPPSPLERSPPSSPPSSPAKSTAKSKSKRKSPNYRRSFSEKNPSLKLDSDEFEFSGKTSGEISGSNSSSKKPKKGPKKILKSTPDSKKVTGGGEGSREDSDESFVDEEFMKMLGNADLSKVANYIESLKEMGGGEDGDETQRLQVETERPIGTTNSGEIPDIGAMSHRPEVKAKDKLTAKEGRARGKSEAITLENKVVARTKKVARAKSAMRSEDASKRESAESTESGEGNGSKSRRGGAAKKTKSGGHRRMKSEASPSKHLTTSEKSPIVFSAAPPTLPSNSPPKERAKQTKKAVSGGQVKHKIKTSGSGNTEEGNAKAL